IQVTEACLEVQRPAYGDEAGPDRGRVRLGEHRGDDALIAIDVLGHLFFQRTLQACDPALAPLEWIEPHLSSNRQEGLARRSIFAPIRRRGMRAWTSKRTALAAAGARVAAGWRFGNRECSMGAASGPRAQGAAGGVLAVGA